VANLFDRLGDELPPAGRIRTIAINTAHRHGWVPREWWGDTIDDPNATPTEPALAEDTEPDHVLVEQIVAVVVRKAEKDEYRPEVRLEGIARDVDRIAVVAELARRGLTDTMIASRLAANPAKVRKLRAVAA